MATIYLLAEEPISNHRLQDCRLIAQLEVPQGADIEALQIKAQNTLKKRYGKSLTLNPITEEAAEGYLRSDRDPDKGSMNLDSGTLLWHLARIN
jgi:hypothetical protein